jgi:hypothetical protein
MMGHGAGKFLRGSDCFYQHLPQIQEWAKQLLVENDFPQALPEDAFVFFMHQGYQFSFFRLSEGDNPPTYSYCEGQEQPDFVKSHDQFSDFLSVEINLYLQSLMLIEGSAFNNIRGRASSTAFLVKRLGTRCGRDLSLS